MAKRDVGRRLHSLAEKSHHLPKEPDGIWRVTVPLKPGEHHYRFIVDSEWRDDPECALRVPNPFGSQDAVVKVSASATC